MRKYLCLVFVLFCASLSAQPSFEGIVELKMSSGDKPDMGITRLFFSSLGSRLETEMKISPNMKPFKTVRLFKKESPNMYYILNDDAATYSITDLSTYKTNPSNEKELSVKVLATEMVNGFKCKHLQLTSQNGNTEMWTTKELMDYDSYRCLNESDVRSRNSSYAKALIDAGAEGFPVKTIKKDGKGNEITIELVKVERKILNKSILDVPANYMKTQTPTTGMEGMMQEIKQMGEQPLKEE